MLSKGTSPLVNIWFNITVTSRCDYFIVIIVIYYYYYYYYYYCCCCYYYYSLLIAIITMRYYSLIDIIVSRLSFLIRRRFIQRLCRNYHLL